MALAARSLTPLNSAERSQQPARARGRLSPAAALPAATTHPAAAMGKSKKSASSRYDSEEEDTLLPGSVNDSATRSGGSRTQSGSSRTRTGSSRTGSSRTGDDKTEYGDEGSEERSESVRAPPAPAAAAASTAAAAAAAAAADPAGFYRRRKRRRRRTRSGPRST